MQRRLLVLIGTRKGAFILEGDPARRESPDAWTLRGPFCDGWPVNHVALDPATGTVYAAASNPWFGPAVWRSEDLGATWTHSSAGLEFPDGSAVAGLWHITPADGVLHLGVEPAALFRSTDRGASWSLVRGLWDHPSRPTWVGGAGGLILHTILVHPDDPRRLFVAISSAGVFATEDDGATWEPRNRGVRADYMPEDQRYPEIGQCVHKVAFAAGRPDRLYQQNHCGQYRSDDAGRSWVSLEAGLPSEFGFGVLAHPRDPETAYVIPLSSPERGRSMPDARMAVWRTRDAGATWSDLRSGLPQEGAHLGVLREGMAGDELEPFGIYVGTSTGQLFASTDEGTTWRRLADLLPGILSVETALVER
jgi:photosystem II stability/assembly factor-like uncharacterized protein